MTMTAHRLAQATAIGDICHEVEKAKASMGTSVLWITGAICFPVFAVSLRFAFQMSEDAEYQSSARWFFCSFAPLGIVSVMWAVNGDGSIMSKNVILGLVGALIGASALIYVGYAFGDSPPKPSNDEHKNLPLHDILAQNITSYNQKGGITAGTVNVAPQRLAFTDQLGAELLLKMPIKKKVNLRSIGGNADQNVASQIQEFLQHNGYEVSRTAIGMLAPPPDSKVALGEDASGYVLEVAPSAN